MISWEVPSKTFLVGEYIAISGHPAVLLTTTPCFKVQQIEEPKLINIHPSSPAGRLWGDAPCDFGLLFKDPFRGMGGMGASTAQFIGAFKALNLQLSGEHEQQALLKQYAQYAWSGKGKKPSGYDLLAQTSSGCVVIHRNEKIVRPYRWPFDDLSFVLVHTKKKLATHDHLNQLALSDDLTELRHSSEKTVDAFIRHDEHTFLHSVNQFGQALEDRGLVAEHTRRLISKWSALPAVLGIKGCGAMGADIILMFAKTPQLVHLVEQITRDGYPVVATSADLFLSTDNHLTI